MEDPQGAKIPVRAPHNPPPATEPAPCRLSRPLPGGLHDILPQLLQVFSAPAGQVKVPAWEISARQEAQLFLGAQASCPAEVLKLLSPLSPEGLNGCFLPETKRDRLN